MNPEEQQQIIKFNWVVTAFPPAIPDMVCLPEQDDSVPRVYHASADCRNAGPSQAETSKKSLLCLVRAAVIHSMSCFRIISILWLCPTLSLQEH